ncbi:MAG: ribosome maturation factor RimM [Candidatus Melainabacteria bacterium]|nr:ribosome maturation factor RimM [Candidatus Melainabacteria bacterium]
MPTPTLPPNDIASALPAVSDADRLIRVGHIVGVHGIRGEVRIKADDPEAPWADHLDGVFAVHPKQPQNRVYMRIVTCRRPGKNRLILSLDALFDRTTAEKWVGSELLALEQQLPAPPENTWRIGDLVDLPAATAAGGRIGVVSAVYESGGQDYLEIQLDCNQETLLIPFLEHFVPDVRADGLLLANLDDFLEEAMAGTPTADPSAP